MFRNTSTIICTLIIWGALAHIFIENPPIDIFAILILVSAAASATIGIARANSDSHIDCPYAEEHDDDGF